MDSMHLWPEEISKKQLKDTSLVIVAGILVAGLYFQNLFFFKLALGTVVFIILFPFVFMPFAYFWFFLANVLSAISSRLVLSLLFLILVTPVGLLRKWLKKDRLMMYQFKMGSSSVFQDREKTYMPDDLAHPF